MLHASARAIPVELMRDRTSDATHRGLRSRMTPKAVVPVLDSLARRVEKRRRLQSTQIVCVVHIFSRVGHVLHVHAIQSIESVNDVLAVSLSQALLVAVRIVVV